MTAWLAGLLSSIIRPIIQQELAGLKDHAFDQMQRLESYRRHDHEAQELIEEMANATTTEHKRAILRKLHASRATLK